MKSVTFSNIGIIFRKEIRETLRDRRTLFITVLLPILLYPLLLLGMGQLIVLQTGKIKQRKVKIAVSGKPASLKMLEKDKHFQVIWNVDDVRQFIKQKKAEIGIVVSADFSETTKNLAQIPLPRFVIYYSKADEKSRMAVSRVQILAQRLLDKRVHYHLQKRKQPHSIMRPFRIVVKNTAKAKEEGAFQFGRLLAFLIIIMAVSFTLYPAIDMGAGEKERGTMETLLILPANRIEIVLGKYAAIFVISIIGSILNLTSMGLTFGQFANITSKQIAAVEMDATKTSHNTQQLWDVIDEPETTLWQMHGAITSTAFLPRKNHILCVDTQSVSIWDIEKERQVVSLPLGNFAIRHFTISPNKKFALGSNVANELWHLDFTNKQAKQITGYDDIRHIGIAPNGKIAALGFTSQVYIMRCSSWKIARKLDYSPAAICFSPDNRSLAICSREVVIVDVATGKTKQTIAQRATNAAFSPDGKYLLCGDDRGGLRLWNLETAQQQWPQTSETAAPAHNGAVTTIAFAANGKFAVSAGVDGTAWLWKFLSPQLQQLQLFTGHEAPITTVDISNTGDCISGGADGLVKFWKQTPRIRFHVSLTMVLTILLVLLPVTGLFAAVCLALSVFAKTYKEAQYYLTPLLILVLPMAIVAFIPGISLTPARCLLPVGGVVLLYKAIFLGEATLLHVILVFSATVFYAVIALVLAIRLFSMESIIFNNSEDFRWEFWSSNTRRQEIFIPAQAMVVFLIITVLFHFGSSAFIHWNPLLVQIVSQFICVGMLPIIIALLWRLNIRKVFHLAPSKFMHFFAALLLIISGHLLARELNILQLQLFPVAPEYFTRLQEVFALLTKDASVIVLFIGFAIVPGVCEELLFRGMLLSSFQRQMSETKSICITAVLFAVMHMNFPQFTFYVILGLILGLITVRTASIYPAIFAHIAHNGLAVILGFVQKNQQVMDPKTHMPWPLICAAAIMLAVGLRLIRAQK